MFEPEFTAWTAQQQPAGTCTMAPGWALRVGWMWMRRLAGQLLEKELACLVQRDAGPVGTDPRAEAGNPGRPSCRGQHRPPLRGRVQARIVLHTASARRPRLQHQPAPAQRVAPGHAKHFADNDHKSGGVVELGLTVVRRNPEIDWPRQRAVMHVSAIPERDLPHQVKGVVVPRPHPMPRVFRGKIVVFGSARAAKKAADIGIGFVHRDLPATPGKLVGRGQTGNAGSVHGNGSVWWGRLAHSFGLPATSSSG